MKQRTIEFRRFLSELYHDFLKLSVYFFLLGAFLLTSVFILLNIYSIFLYFIVLFLSLFISWLILFRRKRFRKDFSEDE